MSSTGRRITRTVEIVETPRVMQARGLFDVQPSPISTVEWDVHLDLSGRQWLPLG